MSGIYVEPGQPSYVSFPLQQMAATLSRHGSLDSFVANFTRLPLKKQLALFSLREEDRADIEQLAARLKPGDFCLRASSVTHSWDCGSSSGEHTVIHSDSFSVGERGLYFAAKTEREQALSIKRKGQIIDISGTPGPRVLRIMPVIDLQGHYSVSERGPLFGQRYRELLEGDLIIGHHTHYLEQDQPPEQFEPTNTRLVLGVKSNTESFKMLRQQLRKTG